jgi:hypothetical protein
MRRVLSCLVVIAFWSDVAGACSRVNQLPSADALVARASVIVVAAAARYEIQPAGPGRGLIEFHVEGILRGGELLPGSGRAPLLVAGRLTDVDDFNDRNPPYTFVRPTGRRGSCFADEYRQGARFLLLLNPERDGTLTPYWEALAPTNEQLHTNDHLWLAAVRRFATGGQPR